MIRCASCGASIAKGYEVMEGQKSFHHGCLTNQLDMFEKWIQPHLDDGKLPIHVFGAYLSTYPARTIPLLIELKNFHDRHKDQSPAGQLQGTEAPSRAGEGKE